MEAGMEEGKVRGWLAFVRFDEENGPTLRAETEAHELGELDWKSPPQGPPTWRVWELVTERTEPPLDRVVLVGRSVAADVVVKSRWVSVVHAAFHLRGGGWWLEDRGSLNGTWRNGTRLAPRSPVKLQEGDILSFGGVAAEFWEEGPDRPPAP